MPIIWGKTSVYFRCDIPGCDADETIPCDDDYLDRRSTVPKARDLGWSIGHHQKAFCPDCTKAATYDFDDGLP